LIHWRLQRRSHGREAEQVRFRIGDDFADEVAVDALS